MKSLLIVDDEKDLRDLLERFFIDRGYHVFTAAHGLEALQILADIKVDCIITDILMPKLSGQDFLKLLSETPAIVFSGMAEILEDDPILKKAKFVFQKPKDFEFLNLAVKKVINDFPIS